MIWISESLKHLTKDTTDDKISLNGRADQNSAGFGSNKANQIVSVIAYDRRQQSC
jgi:hypothetical protein